MKRLFLILVIAVVACNPGFTGKTGEDFCGTKAPKCGLLTAVCECPMTSLACEWTCM